MKVVCTLYTCGVMWANRSQAGDGRAAGSQSRNTCKLHRTDADGARADMSVCHRPHYSYSSLQYSDTSQSAYLLKRVELAEPSVKQHPGIVLVLHIARLKNGHLLEFGILT